MASTTTLSVTALPGAPQTFVPKGEVTPSPTFTDGLFGIFLYTAANWGSRRAFHFEAVIKALHGTVYARLYDITTGGQVGSSELSTTSSSFVRLRSPALTLTDGHEYEPRPGAESPNVGSVRALSIISVEQ